LPDRGLEGGEALLELADLEEVRGRRGGRDEHAQAGDAILETNPVGDDDVEQATNARDCVEARQVVGDRDRAFLAPTETAQAAGLGRLLGPLGVVAEAVGRSRRGAIWQGWPSALA